MFTSSNPQQMTNNLQFLIPRFVQSNVDFNDAGKGNQMAWTIQSKIVWNGGSG